MEKYEVIRNVELHSNRILKILQSNIDSEHSMYAKTVERCKSVKEQLEECIGILDLFIEESAEEQSVPEVVDVAEVIDTIDEEVSSMPSKEIMRHYAENLFKLSNTDTNILEVSMCCRLLASWFGNRYMPEIKNPKFFYKASKIHNWIDAILITYGEAVHNNRVHIYCSELNDWISSLITDLDNVWPLPYFIQQRIKSNYLEIPYEAVVIEHLIKPKIYGPRFYPEYLDTIFKQYEATEGVAVDFSDINQCIYNSNFTVIGAQ